MQETQNSECTKFVDKLIKDKQSAFSTGKMASLIPKSELDKVNLADLAKDRSRAFELMLPEVP
jgi:hypothetical protein